MDAGPDSASPPRADGPGGVHVGGENSGSINTGTQVDSGGGAVFLRAVEAHTLVGRDQIVQYFNYGALPVAWPRESEARYLSRVRDEFVASLRSRSLAATEGAAWDAGFVQPLLSCRRMSAGTGATSRGGGQRSDTTTTGSWADLAHGEPQLGMLVGETHSGRSLLMRWIVARLADRGEPAEGAVLPVYLSLSRFPFEDAHGLLDTVAFACGQQPETMRDFWYTGKRRLFLAIDDADQIPAAQRDAFLLALKQLDVSRRAGHSILVACRPGSDGSSLQSALARILASSPGSVQWVVLPLDEPRIQRLLDAYGAEPWLKSLVAGNERLRWLVRHPGVLADLVRATRDIHLIAPPHNLAQLYQLFVDGYLFGGVLSPQQAASPEGRKRYHYGRVKQHLLGYLAFRMLASPRPNGIAIDDALCRELADRLESLATEFSRTRRYMPDDWNVSDALQELFDSPVVNRDAARADEFEFSSPTYRDYYAAVHLHDLGEGWREAARMIKASSLDEWTDALVLLSGLPPRDTTNALLNEVLADEPDMAADLWLEKGAVGFTKVPDCVARAFDAQRSAVRVPDRVDHPVHPSVPYFRRVVRQSDPAIALQAVNGLLQLGIDAIDPLLDAVESRHPLVAASAIHGLFHLGMHLATGSALLTPLVDAAEGGLVFSNLGTCNARIGELELVDVPRTMRAEITARFGKLDFDPFGAETSFELWHTPVAWFAIDHFARLGRVDWVGLAAACDGVVRCAGLIVGKAQRRGAMAPIVEEMTQCAVTYDHLGRLIANDLAMPWALPETPNVPPQLIAAVDQCYRELRLAFNPANRGRTLGAPEGAEAGSLALEQNLAELTGELSAIDAGELAVEPSADADLPTLLQLAYAQNIAQAGLGAVLKGIHVGRIAATPVRAVEVISLSGIVNLGRCEDARLDGIVIDDIRTWDGVRARLEINVGSLARTRLTGIRARCPGAAAEPPPA